MRYLHPDHLRADDAKLVAIRDAILQQRRSKTKGKGRAEKPGAESTTQRECGLAFDLSDATLCILDALKGDGTTAIVSGPRLASAVLALEVLDFVLEESVSVLSKTDTPSASKAREVWAAPLLVNLATTIYAVWDSGPPALLHKCKSAIGALLALSDSLSSPVVSHHLLAQLRVAPWLNKRSINIFDSLLPYLSIDDLSCLTAKPSEPPSSGVLRRFTHGMAAADEVATLSGKVALKWIAKVWSQSSESQDFWVAPVLDAVQKAEERGRTNVCLYLLPGLFKARNTAFSQLVTAGKLLVDAKTELQLSAALAVLKVGNELGFLDLADSGASQLPPSTSNSAPKPRIRESGVTVVLPPSLLRMCLYHASPSLRCSALSLLVLTPQASSPLPSSSFINLRTFYTYSMGEESSEFRMASLALSGRLLVRLRDSAWKAHRRDPVSSTYVAETRAFMEWFSSTLFSSLNPARPFRTRLNALRLLDLLFQAQLDPAFSTSSISMPGGYSSYRRTAPAPGPQFQAKHGRVVAETVGWPFQVALITPAFTFSLLRLLLSTYTALRNLSITLLERFPSPLPGYENDDGRAQTDLLVPALKMIRSGREAETSAGAAILALVWRKWVFEGGAKWDLSEIGGWKENASANRINGHGPLSFISSLMDLADAQISEHKADLGRAASRSPMHGTLLALRQLFSSLPPSSFSHISTPEERKAVFHRALTIVEDVWHVTAPVLAASAPEGMGTVDTEEARAMLVEEVTTVGVDEEDCLEEESAGGPIHKIILSATWRAMKEAGDLLETILRLPSELGGPAFQAIWSQSDVDYIGDLFATWLARIRHRGAFMAIHPCYSRACAALLLCTDWPEVQRLPVKWLDVHLDSIISKKISITRRSAGIPYCILGIFTALLPTGTKAFKHGLERLFEIAESKTNAISDESRVHAMNTLRTTFLDAKAALAVGPYVERGFLVSISMFWSPNWICRNVAMMLFAALVTRAFSARRTNLSRDSSSLQLRLTTTDFFGRYPSLHEVLLSELEVSSQKHLDDLPTSNLQSSLFSVLMLLSLLQSPDRVDAAIDSLSAAFIPLVRSCSKSRVWKIRDAAGDALTGLISPAAAPAVCVELLDSPEAYNQNELHGRLVQVLRLLEAQGIDRSSFLRPVHEQLNALSLILLSDRQSFAVRATVLAIARVCALAHGLRSPVLLDLAHDALEASRCWTAAARHTPSAEEFVTAAFRLALAYEPQSVSLVRAGLASPFLEVQRRAVEHLSTDDAKVADLQAEFCHRVQLDLLRLALSERDAVDVRVSAVDALAESKAISVFADADLLPRLEQQYTTSRIIPLRESLLPLIARVSGDKGNDDGTTKVLEFIIAASSVDESVESREAAALAIRNLGLSRASLTPEYAKVLLQVIQDDDPTVREIAGEAFSRAWNDGSPTTDRRSVELIVATFGGKAITDYRLELEIDSARISSPSSLLFAIERPNIFVDDLLEIDCTTPSSPTPSSAEVKELIDGLAAAVGSNRENGPLGALGNELICKWALRVARFWDRLQSGPGPRLPNDEFVEWLRGSFIA